MRYTFRRSLRTSVVITEKIILEEVPEDYELQLLITPVFYKIPHETREVGDADCSI